MAGRGGKSFGEKIGVCGFFVGVLRREKLRTGEDEKPDGEGGEAGSEASGSRREGPSNSMEAAIFVKFTKICFFWKNRLRDLRKVNSPILAISGNKSRTVEGVVPTPDLALSPSSSTLPSPSPLLPLSGL